METSTHNMQWLAIRNTETNLKLYSTSTWCVKPFLYFEPISNWMLCKNNELGQQNVWIIMSSIFTPRVEYKSGTYMIPGGNSSYFKHFPIFLKRLLVPKKHPPCAARQQQQSRLLLWRRQRQQGIRDQLPHPLKETCDSLSMSALGSGVQETH